MPLLACSHRCLRRFRYHTDHRFRLYLLAGGLFPEIGGSKYRIHACKRQITGENGLKQGIIYTEFKIYL